MVANLRHNGETCTAANRFYVEAPIAAEFAERLSARFAALTVGPGIDPGSQVGPLIDAAGREKVERLVQASIGATATTGGRRPPHLDRGFFYEPTVLTGVDPASPVVAEEIFGPVAPIVAFDAEDDAVAWANDSIHSLAGYVFTADLARGLRVAEALKVGMVRLNKGVVSDPPRRSAASSNPAWAGKAATRASSPSASRSTSPLIGDPRHGTERAGHYIAVLASTSAARRSMAPSVESTEKEARSRPASA
jgi:acyl-CoA reductase-like NAD-dependent aldehyde dehydrogenase